MKTILVINADRLYYASLKAKYNLIFREPNFTTSPFYQSEEIIEWLKQTHQEIDGVIGYLDADMTIASIISERLLLVAPSVSSMYRVQNKAEFSRVMASAKLPYPGMQEINISNDELPFIEYPLFLKPDKGSLSAFSYVIESEEEYKQKKVLLSKEKNISQPIFHHFFSHFDKKYENLQDWFIVQSLCLGSQYNIDGYVIDGVVHSMGITKAVTTEDGRSFVSFEYPADVSDALAECAEVIAQNVLRAVGFDNSGFNMEFFVKESGELVIIELNPRMSPGFFALFEERYEITCMEMLFQVALGEKPNEDLKAPKRKAISYPLRVFTDRYVKNVPTPDRFLELEKNLDIVEIDIWVKQGEKLSDRRQDAYSFRYGLVHIGGVNFEQILEKKNKLMDILAVELTLSEIAD